MQIIQYGASFNPSNTFVNDVFLQVIPPQAYFAGIPTSVGAAIGTASWGKLNSPRLMSNPGQLVNFYGGMGAAALTDIHDLCTDVTLALNQSQGQAGLQMYGIRVSDGTDLQAQLALFAGTTQTVTLTGAPDTGDVVNLLVTNAGLPGGFYLFQYVVLSGDTTLSLLATSIKNALNANSTLSTGGITATSSAAIITLSWSSSIGAVSFVTSTNGLETLTVGGTATQGDVLTLTVHDSGLSGGTHSIAYTVQNSDTTTTIATAISAAINADTTLTGIGISATHSGAIVSIASVSHNQTAYTKSLSVGATATLTLAAGPGEFAAVGTSTLGATIKAKWSGVMGNQIAVILAAGFAPNTVNVTIVPFAGGGNPELFTGLPGSGTLFWTALQNAINSGAGRALGPSNWVVCTGAQTTSNTPQLGVYTLGGGTDGRAVDSAQLIGANQPTPTGMYTLQRTQFLPTVMWICGLTDDTTWSTVQNFCDQNIIFGLLTFPVDTDTDTAVNVKADAGIADYQIGFVKDWVYFFDQVNQQTRLVPPLAVAGGLIATLPPWFSPDNQKVYGIIGTERNSIISGDTPYGYAELNQLGAAGIMVLTNPIPQGAVFGFANGYNSVGNGDVTAVVEYSRMTNYLIKSNGILLGRYVGQLQSTRPNDPLRSRIRTAINSFLNGLAQVPAIDSFSVICDLTNNTPDSIAAHVLVVQENVRYLSSALFIFAQLQGGTTVQTATNQLGQVLFQTGG